MRRVGVARMYGVAVVAAALLAALVVTACQPSDATPTTTPSPTSVSNETASPTPSPSPTPATPLETPPRTPPSTATPSPTPTGTPTPTAPATATPTPTRPPIIIPSPTPPGPTPTPTATGTPTPTPTPTSTPTPVPALENATAVLEATQDSVVRVLSTHGTASGVILEIVNGNSALVLTSQFVTGRALSAVNVTTRMAGGPYTGTVVGRDSLLGLAVVRICCSDSFQPITFSDSPLAPGDTVYIVGYPLGAISPTVTERAVTLAAENESTGRTDLRLNGGMNAGTTGGPMLDATGRMAASTVYRARPSTAEIGIEDHGTGLPLDEFIDRLDSLKSGNTHVAPTPTPIPSVSGGVYRSPVFGYEIDVPVNWIMDTGSVAKVRLWNPNVGNVVFVEVTGVSRSLVSVEEVVDAMPISGRPGWGNFQVTLDEEITRYYAGSTMLTDGHEFRFTFNIDGAEWRGIAHWFLSNTGGTNNLYQVYALAPKAVTDLQEYFDVELEMRRTLVSFGPPKPF